VFYSPPPRAWTPVHVHDRGVGELRAAPGPVALHAGVRELRPEADEGVRHRDLQLLNQERLHEVFSVLLSTTTTTTRVQLLILIVTDVSGCA